MATGKTKTNYWLLAIGIILFITATGLFLSPYGSLYGGSTASLLVEELLDLMASTLVATFVSGEVWANTKAASKKTRIWTTLAMVVGFMAVINFAAVLIALYATFSAI